MAKSSAWKLDREAVLRLLILTGFSYWLYQLAYSGNLRLFVHPRFTTPVMLAAACLLVLAVFQATQLLRPLRLRYQPLAWGRRLAYVIVIVPLLIGLYLPPIGLGVDQAERLGRLSVGADDRQVTTQVIAELSTLLEGADGHFLVPAGSFHDFSTLLWQQPDGLFGKQVELVGFIHSLEGLPPNQALISRYEISCCAADAVVVGSLCQFPADQQPPINGWLTIRGEISAGEYQTQPVGLIMVESMQATEPPDDPYIYTGK